MAHPNRRRGDGGAREQRCWFHLSANVLNCLPKFAQPGARAALAEIYNVEDRDHAVQAVEVFEADYGVKWPEAVAKITDHVDVLLEFFNHPAEHWINLRTTNPSRPSRPSGCASASRPGRERLASRWRSS